MLIRTLAIALLGFSVMMPNSSAQPSDPPELRCIQRHLASRVRDSVGENYVARILAASGLNANVTTVPCEMVGDARAFYEDNRHTTPEYRTRYPNLRAGMYIIYNAQWLRQVTGSDSTQAVAIFAHEIAHIVSNDLLPGPRPSRHDMELAADGFAACAVARQGGDLEKLEDLLMRIRDARAGYPSSDESISLARDRYVACGGNQNRRLRDLERRVRRNWAVSGPARRVSRAEPPGVLVRDGPHGPIASGAFVWVRSGDRGRLLRTDTQGEAVFSSGPGQHSRLFIARQDLPSAVIERIPAASRVEVFLDADGLGSAIISERRRLGDLSGTIEPLLDEVGGAFIYARGGLLLNELEANDAPIPIAIDVPFHLEDSDGARMTVALRAIDIDVTSGRRRPVFLFQFARE